MEATARAMAARSVSRSMSQCSSQRLPWAQMSQPRAMAPRAAAGLASKATAHAKMVPRTRCASSTRRSRPAGVLEERLFSEVAVLDGPGRGRLAHALARGLPVLSPVLGAFLVVDDDVDGYARPAGPARRGRTLAVSDQVPAHGRPV